MTTIQAFSITTNYPCANEFMTLRCPLILVLLFGTCTLLSSGKVASYPQGITAQELIQKSIQSFKAEDFEAAYKQAEQARAISRRRNAKAREARAANLMALSSMSMGHITEAISLFKESSALSTEVRADDVSMMQVLAVDRAGRLSRVAGRYEDARWCFNQALQLYRQRKDRVGELATLNNLSVVFSDTGDFAKAEQALQEALPLSRQLDNRQQQRSLLTKFLVLEKGRGNLAKALEYGERAKAVEIRPMVDPNSRAMQLISLELHYQMGMLYAETGQYSNAFEAYKTAQRLAGEFRVPQLQGFVLGEIAGLHLRLGDTERAKETAAQSLGALLQGGGNKHFESRVLFIKAEAERKLGENSTALLSYRQAIAAMEQARLLSIPTEISRAGLVASRHEVFAGAIDFLLSQGFATEALEVSEAYHARAFLDVLAGAGIESATELPLDQRKEEDRLFARIASVQREMWKVGIKPDEEVQLSRKLEEAEAALDSFRLRTYRGNRQYARVSAPAPIKADRIARDVLPSDTALIEFVIGDKASYAWIVTQDKLAAITLPPGKEVESLVKGYRETLAGKVNSLNALQEISRQKVQGRRLYEKLLQPLASNLNGQRKLIIVPDGVLSYLPFETLFFEQGGVAGYLLERFAISYAPSASALHALNSHSSSPDARGFVGFGDPQYQESSTGGIQAVSGIQLRQLPYTRMEVNEIAALFPKSERDVYLGTEALEQNVKAAPLARYRYVHFAAHGVIDEEHPGRSGIMLGAGKDSGEDGMLQMGEVMRLKLNADLVTLSACRTGLGKLMRGEGMIGLTRSFLYSGAESVTVSLWSVNDIATATLMKSFYRHLQGGKTKDEALRAAKLEMLKGAQRSWRHPFFWAAFILVGEPV